MLLNTKSNPRNVVIAVLHELLNVRAFAYASELKEALKCRCASLRIPYDAGIIAAALDTVSHARPLVQSKRPVEYEARQPTFAPPLSRAEARDVLARRGLVPRAMPALERDDYARDSDRANEIRRQAAAMESAVMQWTRLAMPKKCGYCDTMIAAGAPLLVIRHGAWTKFRCADCARVPASDTLDPAPAPPADDRLTRIDRVAGAALLRFTGQPPLPIHEREPGEEG